MRRAGDKDGARCSQTDVAGTGVDRSAAYSGRGVVTGTRRHRGAGHDTELRRGLGLKRAGFFGTVQKRRQPRALDTAYIDHLAAPPAMLNI